MELELRQLSHLLAIAREGSFSKAAKLRGLSQPALSSSIAQLEARAGVKLLSRGRHGATLTEAGRRLVRHAEIVENQLTKAELELRARERGMEGPLVIGVTPVAAAQLVPQALGKLAAELPLAAISVVETVFSEAMAALLNGSMDIMVGPIGAYPRVEGIVEERLTNDPFCLVVRRGHPLAKRRRISLQRLDAVRFVLPSEQSVYHHQLAALFVVAGLQWPTNHIATNAMTAMKAVVMNSDCVAIMPKRLIALERQAGLLSSIDLAEARTARALGLSWAKDRPLSPLAAAFAETARKIAREKPFQH
jgi:molybdate transport repressor ModE-like protein